MLALPQSLETSLANGATTLCMCWRLVRSDGQVLGFTDHDRDLAFGDTVFAAHTGFSGSALTTTADLAVDNTQIDGILDSEGLSGEALLAGHFDGAEVELWRVDWRDPSSRVLLKTGLLGEITQGEYGFSAEIRGLSHHLDQTVGRLYQRQCDANVGDQRCSVNLDTPEFTSTGTVASTISETGFHIEGGAKADGSDYDADWFAEGQLFWLSGRNAGRQGFVKSSAPGSISLWQPPGLPVEPGDSFRLTAGCNRRLETCRDKFQNVLNFRGFAHMPGNDFIISYPLARETNDGGRR